MATGRRQNHGSKSFLCNRSFFLSTFFLLNVKVFLSMNIKGLRILKRIYPDFRIAFLTSDLIPVKLFKERIATLCFIPDFIKASARFSKLIRRARFKSFSRSSGCRI